MLVQYKASPWSGFPVCQSLMFDKCQQNQSRMEFDDLGSRCSVRTCRQHDFLPFTCSTCSLQFCDTHQRRHDCVGNAKSVQKVPLVCPTCTNVVQVVPYDCPAAQKGVYLAEHECFGNRERSRRCQFNGCRTRPLVHIQCSRCARNFCIPHRSEIDHHCQAERSLGDGHVAHVSKAHPTSQIPPLAGYSNSPAAPCGDPKVEGALRAYYEIENDGKRTFWFFNRRWSIAKVLETVNPGQRSRAIADGRQVSPLDHIGSIPQHSHILVVRDEGGCSRETSFSPKCGRKDIATC
jgi:AN1-type zinc finger protein 2